MPEKVVDLTPFERSTESKVKTKYAPLAQLDRALVYGTKGWGFELLMAHQTNRGDFVTPVCFYDGARIPTIRARAKTASSHSVRMSSSLRIKKDDFNVAFFN